METRTLTVELSEDLYTKFMGVVTGKGGRWRSCRKKDTASGAVQSAVTDALMLFLQDGQTELPEFREYAREKYPELDEDLITMIESLIKREKQKAPALKRTIYPTVTPRMAAEIGRREIKKEHPHLFEG